MTINKWTVVLSETCFGFLESRLRNSAIMAGGKNPDPKNSDEDRKGIGKGVSSREVNAEVAKALAASEKERLAKAKLIAAEIQRKAILEAANQNGGSAGTSGTLSKETPEHLRNMCSILNRGFASFGSDMKNLKSSFGSQMHALTESIELNFNDLWNDYEETGEEDMSVVGSEAEPPPPAPFRPEHELSDEEDDDEVPNVAGAQGAVPEVGGLNLARDSYFAKLARALRAPSNVRRPRCALG